jgi:aspartate/methionine/tyrosine aminotransferase
MQLSSRLKGVRGEGAFDVLVKARALEAQGKSIIHMEIGEPDFPTPRNVIDAGKRALDSGHTKYGPTQGEPALREAIAAHIAETRGFDAEASRVVVTPGAKPILFYAMLALLEEGDEAMFPNPGFPIYESMINYTGAKAVSMPLVEERGFTVDLDEFRNKLSDKTKLIVLCSPQNPTGGSIREEDLREIAALVKDRDVVVLSDEIYSRIVFDGKPFSISSVPGMEDKTIVLDGFSKTYSMTGWRIGYGHFPQWLVDPVCLLMVNSASHTASFTQQAALEALTGPQDSVDVMVAEFKRRRDLIVSGFNGIPGFRCANPSGAFYAFPNVTGTGISSKVLADRILNVAGVSCLDGGAFGKFGEGYLRFSYATAYEKIEEGLARIRKMMAAV